MSASEYIQSLPAYVTIPVALLTVILVIGLAPFGGYLITRRGRQEGFVAMGYSGPAEDYEAWWAERKATPPKDSGQKFGALDVTFLDVRTAVVDASPTMLLGLISVPMAAGEVFPAEPIPVDEPTEENPLVPVVPERVEPPAPVEEPEPPLDPGAVDGADQDRGLPQWATMTKEWSVVEAFDAELVEAEDEATRLFKEDPLRSWVMPPLEEFDYLPEADRTFRDLVARNWLTGEGAEISTEWEPWYGGSLELEGAST
jgi:hypothetical protein